MIRIRSLRRAIAFVLIVAGAALMLLSPSVRAGLAAFVLGVVLELVGLLVDRRTPPQG